MKRIGILAYGSLIDNPGPELEPNTAAKIEDVNTPFMVEFAREEPKPQLCTHFSAGRPRVVLL